MKKDTTPELKAELDKTAGLLDALRNEICGSDDFILSYIKSLAMLHDGRFNLEELRHKYNWKMPKVAALSAAINHFASRGLIKRGDTHNDVILK